MESSIEQVITGNRDRVQAWLRNEPGAWGALAGQAVLAERRRHGRPLSELERRVVWQALWDRLLLERGRAGAFGADEP